MIVAVGLTQIDFADVGDALAELSVPLAVLSWALLLTGQVVSGVRWRVIAAAGRSALDRVVPAAYLRGWSATRCLPTGIGGDAMRIAVLRHDIGLKESTARSVVDSSRAGSGRVASARRPARAFPLTGYLGRAADPARSARSPWRLARRGWSSLAVVLARRGGWRTSRA